MYLSAINEKGRKIWVKKIVDETSLFNDYYVSSDGRYFYTPEEVKELREVEPIKIELDEQETVAYWDFCENHRHIKDRLGLNFGGAIGGKHALVLTGTGLGYIKTAKCHVCGETKDITNYDNW